MELLSSKGSNGSKIIVEITEGRIQFHPLISPLNNRQLLVVFDRFIRAIREGRAATSDVVGGRLIVAITPYKPETGEGGAIRLTIDDAYVTIAPTDFLMTLLDRLPPSSKAYGKIMDTLLPHAQKGSGTLEERATACLQSLAASAPVSSHKDTATNPS